MEYEYVVMGITSLLKKMYWEDNGLLQSFLYGN